MRHVDAKVFSEKLQALGLRQKESLKRVRKRSSAQPERAKPRRRDDPASRVVIRRREKRNA